MQTDLVEKERERKREGERERERERERGERERERERERRDEREMWNSVQALQQENSVRGNPQSDSRMNSAGTLL